MTSPTNAARLPIITALAIVGFASNSLLCRAALGAGRIDAVSFTAVRMATGALALLALSMLRNRRTPLAGSSWRSALALFGYALAFSLAYVSVPTGTGALLLFGTVQLSMIGKTVFEGQRPTRAQWAALGLSAVGLVAITLPGLAAPEPGAAALMMVAGLSWAVYSLRGRLANDPLAATAGNFTRALPLAACTLPWALRTGRITPLGLTLAAISGALTSGVAYALWYAALPALGATRAALAQTAPPLLAALGGIALLGERPEPRLAVGALAVVGSVVLGAVRKRGA